MSAEIWASLTYGVMPSRQQWEANVPEEPFPMRIRSQDEWSALATAINQGIDAHLEAVLCEADETTGEITIEDRASVYTLVRRLMESGDETAEDLASSIVYVLGVEWI